MSGDYRVSGGGTTAVESGELIDEAWRLGIAEQHCGTLGERVSSVLGMLDRTDTGLGRSVPELVLARYQLGEVARIAAELGGRLAEAAEGYGLAEQRLAAMRSLTAQGQAWLTGLSARLALPAAVMLGPALVEGAVLSALALKVLGIEPAGLDVEAVRRLITWPGVGETAGRIGDGADELLAGFLGVPAGLALGVGRRLKAADDAALLMGVSRAVATVTGGALLAERAVTVRRVGGTGDRERATGSSVGAPLDPPASIAEFAERMPDGRDGDAQIRIERYDGPAGERPRWVVYVTGTIDFSPVAGEQAVDLTADIASVAARSELADALGLQPGAAERAVRQALAAAGAEPGDEIVGFGYSAGGEVVANLADDPSLNVVGAVNFGGPGEVEASQLLNVRHDEDLVPGTGGAHRAEAPLRFEVRLDPPLDDPGDFPAPGHAIDAYRRTAALVDATTQPDVVAFRTRLAEFVEGRAVTESAWVAERVPADAAAPPSAGSAPTASADAAISPWTDAR